MAPDLPIPQVSQLLWKMIVHPLYPLPQKSSTNFSNLVDTTPPRTILDKPNLTLFEVSSIIKI